MGEDPPAHAFMQGQQAGFGTGKNPSQTLPVAVVEGAIQGLAQLMVQPFGLRHDQLPLPQLIPAPGPFQFSVAEQPEKGFRWCSGGPFPAGEVQAHGPQPWHLHLLEAAPQRITRHQGERSLAQGQGHQQPHQPVGVTARGQAHEGVIAAPQTARHQPAHGQMVRPADAPS